MVTENRNQAPYAPVNHVLNILRRLRERGLPDPLTLRDIERVGVPEGNAPRTLAAIRFLRLIDEDGGLTPTADSLQRASSVEYPQVLTEILRAAYEPVFAIVDPARDDEIAMHDAFRHYEPRGQRQRMVNLFVGLCKEAGLVAGGPPIARTRTRRAAPDSGRPASQAPPVEMTEEESNNLAQPHGPGSTITRIPNPYSEGADYRLLSALIQQLPKDGQWSQARRDKWVQAMTAGVDLLIEVTGGYE